MKNKFRLLFFVVLLVGLVTLAACSSGSSSGAPGGEKETEAGGNPPVPTEYANFKNPVAGDQSAIAAGKTTFEANCASCHGNAGKGDGPAGTSLNPKPADLTQLDSKEDTDGYLYWHIAEGGAPFHSSMPAFKDTLSKDQIWQVVSYLRSISH